MASSTVDDHGRISARSPRYAQIADTLRHRLLAESRIPGVRLPSEPALAREFRVSRETVREALAVLRADGLVYSRTGRGTFASPWPEPVGLRITHPIREPHVSGRPSAIRVLDQGYVAAPPEVRRALGLAAGGSVFLYTILRTIRGRPFRFARVYLPPAVAGRIDLRRPPRLTVSGKLEREGGVRLIRAHQAAMARPAPADAAKALGLTAGRPVLVFRRTYYEESGHAAEFVIDYQDSERFPYEEVFVRAGR